MLKIKCILTYNRFVFVSQMEVKEKSKYFLSDNYKKVFKKWVLALIKTNDSLQNSHQIKRKQY